MLVSTNTTILLEANVWLATQKTLTILFALSLQTLIILQHCLYYGPKNVMENNSANYLSKVVNNGILIMVSKNSMKDAITQEIRCSFSLSVNNLKNKLPTKKAFCGTLVPLFASPPSSFRLLSNAGRLKLRTAPKYLMRKLSLLTISLSSWRSLNHSTKNLSKITKG